VLATVLFTDIVGATQLVAEIGDRAWKELLRQHHFMVRQQIERHRGREINTTGDGFIATFDGPARAVRCGRAISDVLKSLNIQVRVGVHTGECEVIGEELGGIAVHIGARVMAHAGPDEILVSSTVKDLVAGSGLRFESLGAHALKGSGISSRLSSLWRLESSPAREFSAPGSIQSSNALYLNSPPCFFACRLNWADRIAPWCIQDDYSPNCHSFCQQKRGRQLPQI
jgi:class 3 adenylate cyclase